MILTTVTGRFSFVLESKQFALALTRGSDLNSDVAVRFPSMFAF